MGKLDLEYAAGTESLDERRPITVDGRSFYTWVNQPSPDCPGDPATRMVSVRAPSGGWLLLQEAPKLRWTTEQMIAFLGEVRSSPGAVAR